MRQLWQTPISAFPDADILNEDLGHLGSNYQIRKVQVTALGADDDDDSGLVWGNRQRPRPRPIKVRHSLQDFSNCDPKVVLNVRSIALSS
jgi:hypothetical protein